MKMQKITAEKVAQSATSQKSKEQDTITILKDFRQQSENKASFFRTAFIAFFFILIIDINVIVFLRLERLSPIGWVGIWLLLTGLGVSFFLYLDARAYTRSVDTWYLQQIIELDKKYNDRKG